VRGLFGLVLAACLIGLAGPQPVHAEEAGSTPGLWINPELGLRGPMAQHGNDRSRSSFTRERCDNTHVAGDKIMATSHEFASCLALAHVMALRPYEGQLDTKPAFLANQHTIARLSPVLFRNVSTTAQFDAITAEYLGTIHYYMDEHGRKFAPESFLEGQPGDRDMRPNGWAVWAEGPEEEVAGLSFVPRIRLQSHDEFYSFEVWGVGRWLESGDLVLVVLYSYRYNFFRQNLSGNLYRDQWGPAYHVGLLCYDPRFDLFRVINFTDYFSIRDTYGACGDTEEP
jgi:hypothetical protein